MKILRTSLLCAALAMAASAFAVSIDNTAGGLANRLSGQTSITDLTVTGDLDASDFAFISDKLDALTTLDLSGARVVAYTGEATLTGGTEYPANVLPPYSLFGVKASTIVLPQGITEIGEGALGASKITSITIPASVLKIADNAFAGCSMLQTVTVPATVTTVGAKVFSECPKLETANILADITTVPDGAFEGCIRLKTVTLPSAVTAIGANAFNGCTALKSFTFPATLTTIGAKAFCNSGIEKANFANSRSLASIGDFAFANCLSLTEVRLSSTSTALGRGVFFGDTSLTLVQLPASLTVIPEFTFKGNSSLMTDGLIKNGVTEIKDYALSGLTQVRSFILPGSLKALGDGAMEGWTHLESLDAASLKSVPSLGDDVWNGVNQKKAILYTDTDTYDDFRAADQWKEFNIKLKTTDSGISIDDMASGANVDFNLRGDLLIIKSAEAEIARVNVFDLDGRTRYIGEADSDEVILEISRWNGSVIVVAVTLTDGSSAAIKLSI